MTVKLSPMFIATLKKHTEPVRLGRMYECAGCYRKNLKPEQIALVSRAEAYCKPCLGE